MTAPIEDMQAAIAALRSDVDALKAAAAADEQERQGVREWLRRTREASTDPKPRTERTDP